MPRFLRKTGTLDPITGKLFYEMNLSIYIRTIKPPGITPYQETYCPQIPIFDTITIAEGDLAASTQIRKNLLRVWTNKAENEYDKRINRELFGGETRSKVTVWVPGFPGV